MSVFVNRRGPGWPEGRLLGAGFAGGQPGAGWLGWLGWSGQPGAGVSLAWALVGVSLAEGQWLEKCDGGGAGFRGDRRRRHFVFQIPLG